MNDNTKVVMGTLGAALAGAAAGVLMAPKKGTETRSMIKNKANDLTANARQSLDKGYEKSKKTLTDLTEKVKDTFQSNGTNGSTDSAVTGYQKNERYVANVATANPTASGTTGSGSATPGQSRNVMGSNQGKSGSPS